MSTIKKNSKIIFQIVLIFFVIFISMNVKIKKVELSNIKYDIPKKMWAITMKEYNNKMLTEYRNIEVPQTREDEVLVKVKATAIGSLDRDILSGKIKTKSTIPCYSVSGVVVNKGSLVSKFYISDEVFGKLDTESNGACSEYVAIKESNIALKPRVLNHFNSASVSYSSVLAYKLIKHALKLEPGSVVFINDALSAEGVAAVRIAKVFGIKVVAMDSKKDEEFMKEIGVDIFVPKEEPMPASLKGTMNYVIDFSSFYTDIKPLCELLGSDSVIVTDTYYTQYKKNCGSRMLSLSDIKNTNMSNSEILKEVAMLFQKGELKAKVQKVYNMKNFEEAKKSLLSGSTDGKIVINVSGKY